MINISMMLARTMRRVSRMKSQKKHMAWYKGVVMTGTAPDAVSNGQEKNTGGLSRGQGKFQKLISYISSRLRAGERK